MSPAGMELPLAAVREQIASAVTSPYSRRFPQVVTNRVHLRGPNERQIQTGPFGRTHGTTGERR
jgi:hypothetical protein